MSFLSGLIWIQAVRHYDSWKNFFQKVDFEKNQQTTKMHNKLPRSWIEESIDIKKSLNIQMHLLL